MKKLSILLVAILSLCTVLVGCKSETPTDIVNNYFQELKKADSKEASQLVQSSMSGTKTDSKDKNKKSSKSDKIIEEAMTIYVSKLDGKVLSEKVDGDKATVKVKVKGPNFSNILSEVVDESIEAAFSGKEVSEETMSKSILEKVKNSKDEEREGKINLNKGDKGWKIDETDEDILKLMIGEASKQK